MGIVLSALAGAAKGYDEALDADRKEREAVATDVRRSGLEEQRQRALLLFKSGQEDAQRVAMTDRVNQAAGQLADSAVSQKRGIVQQGIADQSAWTPEMQASVDQSLALDRDAVAADPRTRRNAAIRTGDISPEKAATLEDSERRLDTADNRAAAIDAASQRKDERERARLEQKDKTDTERMDRRDAIEAERARIAEKRVDALIAKADAKGSGNPTKEALSFIDGQRKDLASEAQNLRSMYQTEIKDVPSKKRAEIEAAYKPKFEAVERKRAQVESDFGALRERIGLPATGERESSRGADAPAPAAKPAPAASASEKDMRKDVGSALMRPGPDTEAEIARIQRELPSMSPQDRARASQVLNTLRQQGAGQPASRPPLSSFQR